MIHFPFLNLKDAYKIGHPAQYPNKTETVYSNFTPRGTRRDHSDGIIWFGAQYFVMEYLIAQARKNFFLKDRDEVMKAYKRRVDNMLGPGTNIDHIGELHELGYLPLKVKGLPEGSLVNYRIPALTMRNTDKKFGWLPNALESLMSNVLWKANTSATTAFYMRRVFEKYAQETGADKTFIPWQGHDFSFRGMSGIEDACLSGAGHLLSFTGTDTVPAIDFLETYYYANSDVELVGGSVPATEHSVMCIGMKDHEWDTIDRIIFDVYPDRIISVVMDTWDFWKVITEYLPSRRDRILARNGKLVIRPDSGDPVLITCGDPNAEIRHERMGLTRMLYEIFGGTTNDAGFVSLDPHIGWIYGDSITPERQYQILQRLKNQGFASTIPVLGVGSYTYEYVTRDTDGWAMKATYGEIDGKGYNIMKDPKTDDGVKKSASGLLAVFKEAATEKFILKENCTWFEEASGYLMTIFENGRSIRTTDLKTIRAKVESQL